MLINPFATPTKAEDFAELACDAIAKVADHRNESELVQAQVRAFRDEMMARMLPLFRRAMAEGRRKTLAQLGNGA